MKVVDRFSDSVKEIVDMKVGWQAVQYDSLNY